MGASSPTCRSRPKTAQSWRADPVQYLLRFVLFRHWRNAPSRGLLTALGVTLGVMLYVAVALVNRAARSNFEDSVESLTGTAALTVFGGRTGFPSAIIDKVRATDGVSHAVGMIEMPAYFNDKNGSFKTLSVLGIDLLNEASVRSYKAEGQDVIEDPLSFLNQPDSIIVTTVFAKEHQLSLEDKLTLNTAFGIKQFTIRGMLAPTGPATAYGGALAIMDIDAAQLSFGRADLVDRIDVVLREGADQDAVRDALVASLGPGYSVEDPTGQTRQLVQMVQSFQGLLAMTSALALLVAVFMVANAVTMAVAERRREIGTLRAIGVTRKAIVAVFLVEATLLGVIGASAGIALGRLLASVMSDSVSHAMTAQLAKTVAVGSLTLRPSDVVTGLLIGGVTAFVAALVPSLRTTAVSPLEAIKPPDILAGQPTAGKSHAVRALGVILLVLVLVSSRLELAARWPMLSAIDPLFAIAGALLVGPGMVDALLRMLRKLVASGLGKRSRVVWMLACDNLLAKPKRTGANVMGLMVGLMLVVVVAALTTSFRTSIVTWFDDMLAADIFVSSAGNLARGGQVQPLHESMGRELAEVPGVDRRSDGSVTAMRLAHVRFAGQEIGVKAWDVPERPAERAQFVLRDGPKEDSRALYEGSPYRVLISENLAIHYGKRRGDTIDLDTPHGAQRFEIVGVMTDLGHPVGLVYMQRDTYKRLWDDPLVTAFMVRVTDGHSIADVRSAIDARFGKTQGLFTNTLSDLKGDAVKNVDEATTMLQAIEASALVVALFGLLNTLLVSVMERYRELGIYRAIGMSKSQLSSLILAESILQGGFGGLAAALIGAYLSWAYLVGSLSRSMGFVLEYTFPGIAVLGAVFAGLLVAAIAGWLPARRAVGLEITEAIANE